MKSEVENKLEYLLEVVNLMEINKVIPKEIVDRAMNRLTINGLRDEIQEIKEAQAREMDFGSSKSNELETKNNELETKLKKCLEKEMKYQTKNNFLARIFRRFHE